MSFLKRICLLLAAFISFDSHATTGIDSVGYLWVIGLVILGMLGLAVWVLKFLKRVKEDSKKHDK